MLRKLQENDLVGKTIQSAVTTSVNVVKLTFTDGTRAELWAEDAVYTPFGNIPGILIEDPNAVE